jgi:hypothetical protein
LNFLHLKKAVFGLLFLFFLPERFAEEAEFAGEAICSSVRISGGKGQNGSSLKNIGGVFCAKFQVVLLIFCFFIELLSV